MKQIQTLEHYLKEVIRSTGETSASLQAKSQEEINRIDIILYKLFLKQASEDNLYLNEYISKIQAGLVSDDQLAVKYSVLWDIKQYYKNILTP